MFPLEFCGKVNREETSIMGLSSSVDRVWHMVRQTDRQNLS